MPDYANFTIVVGQRTDQGYPVTVTPPAGTVVSGFITDEELGDELNELVLRLKSARGSTVSRGRELGKPEVDVDETQIILLDVAVGQTGVQDGRAPLVPQWVPDGMSRPAILALRQFDECH